MDPVASVFLTLLLMIGVPTVVVTALFTYTNHGELWRPLIGTLLFRKPKIPRGCSTSLLFKVGNHGRPVGSFAELHHARERLRRFIEKRSWFRRTDLERLRYHYDLLFQALHEYEMEKEAARKRQQKHHRAKANDPIPEWRRILRVDANCRDPKVIKDSYRRLVSKEHPDKGGTGKRMPEFNRALDTARRELGFV